MARKIQFRRGIAATWTSTNPTLAIGEFGLETDTGRGKVGTGVTAWVSLPYLDAGAVAHIADTVAAHTAGAIAFTPAGTIAATDLQAAVVEVATDAAAATATVAGDLSTLSSATSDALALKAALASPALTGTPTAPTAVTATSTTQLATTAFVQQERAAQAATDSSRYAPRSSGVAGPDRLVLISGQVHESPTVGSCTLSADTTNFALGTQGHKMTMAGAVTATLVLNPLPIGTLTSPKYTGGALMIYVPDATKVTIIEWELYQDVGAGKRQNMAFRSQIGAYGQDIVTGWNLIRLPNDYRRETYLIGGADMSSITAARILVTTNAATDVTIGYLALETRPKASMILINDGCYRRFFNDTGGAYADMKARNLPVTLAPDVTNLGTDGTSNIITEARIAELAAENRNSVSFHGYSTMTTASASAAVVVGETVKAQQWLAARGYAGRMWRAAWMQNLATNSPATESLVLANPMYTGGYECVHMWPFSNPLHVQRTQLHGRTNEEIDAMFASMELTRGVFVGYTHDVRSDPTGIDMSLTSWQYFMSKVDEGIAAGWLEGATFEMLMERSGLIPQKGIDGTWTVSYPDRSGTMVLRKLI